MLHMNKKNIKQIPALPEDVINDLPDFVVKHIRCLEDLVEQQNVIIEQLNCNYSGIQLIKNFCTILNMITASLSINFCLKN